MSNTQHSTAKAKATPKLKVWDRDVPDFVKLSGGVTMPAIQAASAKAVEALTRQEFQDFKDAGVYDGDPATVKITVTLAKDQTEESYTVKDDLSNEREARDEASGAGMI